jgi:hypothetical protein
MNLKSLISAGCLLALINACSNHIYTPALFHQDIAYQPKPMSFDTVKSATYISGGINFYTDPTWIDMLISGQVNYSRGYVYQNINLAYGAFAVLGDFDKGSSSDDYRTENFTDKFFGAGGIRASANLFTTYDRVDFRYLGIEAAYSHEFGAYANFRQDFSKVSGYHIDARTDLLTIGLTTEIVFHNINDKNMQNGLRLFIGGTFGNNSFNQSYLNHSYLEPDIFNTIFPKVSYFIKFNKYFATVEGGKQVFLRFGYKF